jgi:hypothetical protein
MEEAIVLTWSSDRLAMVVSAVTLPPGSLTICAA